MKSKGERLGWKPLNEKPKTQEGDFANAAAYLCLSEEMHQLIDDEWGNDMALHFWPFELRKLFEVPNDRIAQLKQAKEYIEKEIELLSKEPILNCSSCIKGEMLSTGRTLLSCPPQYQYKCNNCGHIKNFKAEELL